MTNGNNKLTLHTMFDEVLKMVFSLENGDVLLNDEFITDGLLEMPIVKITYNKCY